MSIWTDMTIYNAKNYRLGSYSEAHNNDDFLFKFYTTETLLKDTTPRTSEKKFLTFVPKLSGKIDITINMGDNGTYGECIYFIVIRDSFNNVIKTKSDTYKRYSGTTKGTSLDFTDISVNAFQPIYLYYYIRQDYTSYPVYPSSVAYLGGVAPLNYNAYFSTIKE